jgi:hypothetical protein
MRHHFESLPVQKAINPPASPPTAVRAKVRSGNATVSGKAVMGRLGVDAEMTTSPRQVGKKTVRASNLSGAMVSSFDSISPRPLSMAKETVVWQKTRSLKY